VSSVEHVGAPSGAEAPGDNAIVGMAGRFPGANGPDELCERVVA
jgi:acyl transferase domain-containing protein